MPNPLKFFHALVAGFAAQVTLHPHPERAAESLAIRELVVGGGHARARRGTTTGQSHRGGRAEIKRKRLRQIAAASRRRNRAA